MRGRFDPKPGESYGWSGEPRSWAHGPPQACVFVDKQLAPVRTTEGKIP